MRKSLRIILDSTTRGYRSTERKLKHRECKFNGGQKYVWRMLVLVSLTMLMICAVAPSADADATYLYTGNLFTTFFDPSNVLPLGLTELTGSVTLIAPFAPNFDGPIIPLAFNFTDGVTTISNVNGGSADINLVTDANAELIAWSVKDWIESVTPGDLTEFLVNTTSPASGANEETSYSNGSAYASTNSAGAWILSPTPEPSTLFLFGTGLTALACSLRRSKLYLLFRGNRHSSDSK